MTIRSVLLGLLITLSIEAFACEWDENNNLIPCGNINCVSASKPTNTLPLGTLLPEDPTIDPEIDFKAQPHEEKSRRVKPHLVHKLPSDLLALLMKYLRHGEIDQFDMAFSFASKARYLFLPVPRYKEFPALLGDVEGFNEAATHLLPRTPKGTYGQNPHIQEFKFFYDQFDPHWLSRFPNLRQLTLQVHNEKIQINNDFLSTLSVATHLNELCLGWVEFDPTAELFGKSLAHVRSLQFFQVKISPKQLAQLFQALPNLEEIEISCLDESLWPDGVNIDLRFLPQLKKLYLPEEYALDYSNPDGSSTDTEFLRLNLSEEKNLKEVISVDLLTLIDSPALEKKKLLKFENLLKLLNQLPCLKTVIPNPNPQISWRTTIMEEKRGLHLTCFLNIYTFFEQVDFSESGEDISKLTQAFEPYLEKNWIRGLWITLLTTNLNWKEALPHALELQKRGDSQGIEWFIHLLTIYARDVNPETASPYFEELIAEGKRLSTYPISIQQEREWRANWLRAVAKNNPLFSHLEQEEKKKVTDGDLAGYRNNLYRYGGNLNAEIQKRRQIENKIPPSLLELRQKIKKECLKSALLHLDQTSDDFKWDRHWTGSLLQLLETPEASEEEEKAISFLGQNLERSLSDNEVRHEALESVPNLFLFYSNRSQKNEALKWSKVLLDYPTEYSYGADPLNLVPQLIALFIEDPHSARRLTELLEPQFTRNPKIFSENSLIKTHLSAIYKSQHKDLQEIDIALYRIKNKGQKPLTEAQPHWIIRAYRLVRQSLRGLFFGLEFS